MLDLPTCSLRHCGPQNQSLIHDDSSQDIHELFSADNDPGSLDRFGMALAMT